MATLSAALIVRDEAQFIADCLRSLQGHVDQIVVVDTGSVDDTIDIARQFSVDLHHFRWCNDFSAARNFALDHAKSEWILYIDADERLAIPEYVVLSDLLADRSKVGWRVRLHPRVEWTAYAELRLFRNDPHIRFQGVIHERIQPALETFARAHDLDVGDCAIKLYHVGYEADQRPKNSRNIPLLRQYLSADPNRLYCWWHLGECLRLAGDDLAAIEAWTSGIRRLSGLERQTGDSLLYLSLIKIKHDRGEPIDDLVAQALASFPGHLAFQWIAAQLAAERGELDEAKPVLEKLNMTDADSFFDPELAYDKGLFRHLSAEALALCYFREGRFADAAKLYGQAAQTAPDPGPLELKARLAQLRAHQHLGEPVVMADQAAQ
jgi:Glycosyl transferase family 2/Tetratricopeptide repeat